MAIKLHFTLIIGLFLGLQAAPQFNVLTQPMVYQSPAMAKVEVERGIVFKTVNADTSLKLNIYYPPSFDKKTALPVVIFNNGVGSMSLPDWRIYDDWARLTAANGMIAVTHQSRGGHSPKDLDDLLQYLRIHSVKLKIDRARMGIWVCSANTPVGWAAANNPANSFIKAVAIYYGVTQPNDRMPRRKDLEILLVRAGLDGNMINTGMEQLMANALATDAHVELISYPGGQHAFDALDNTPRTKEIILQTIDFYKRNLLQNNADAESPLISTRRMWHMVLNEHRTDEAIGMYKTTYAVYRKDSSQMRAYNSILHENNLTGLGYQALAAGNVDDAIKVFTLATETFPNSANGFDALSDAYERKGDMDNTVRYARMAIGKVTLDPNISPQFAQAIRESAMGKIENQSRPHKRAHHALVYDAGLQTVMLLSGSTPLNGGNSFKFFNDVWRYKDSAWFGKRIIGDERSGIALAYDTKRNNLFSYGGFSGNTSRGELRILQGNQWKVLSDLPAMAAAEGGLVYDAGRDKLIAFGGSRNRNENNGTTWEWDGYAWLNRGQNGPAARQAFAMVYDEQRNKTVLFGGMGANNKRLSDTWEYDGKTWKLVDTTGPGARMSAGYAYDSKRGRLIIFGGGGDNGALGDTWSWDGKEWKKLADKGPSPRSMGYMAYDAARDRVVLFGGRAGWPNDLGDTWEWNGFRWEEVGKK